MPDLQIAVFVGSLRSDSVNQKLFNALKAVAPSGIAFEQASIGDLPLMNQDMEGDLPAEVVTVKNLVEKSDAILFITPEYNRSVPGVLKNAIDWASRPWGQNSFANKPAAVMGASGGAIGTFGAQQHLRQTLSFLDVHTLGQPELFIGGAYDKFDAAGNLTDVDTKEHLEKFWPVFLAWVERINRK